MQWIAGLRLEVVYVHLVAPLPGQYRSGEREHQLASDPALSVRGHLVPPGSSSPRGQVR
jgi:hypothetical protein